MNVLKLKTAAFKLFDASVAWLKARNIEAVDGPINFGDRNIWWGLLVDGFTEPNYQMPYNFPYYKEFFENYGFQLYYRQFTYQRPMGSEVALSSRMYEKSKLTIDNPDYEFRHITKKEFKKAHHYFMEVYNKAWAGHSGVKPMTEKQAASTFKKLKPISDVRLVWFAFYKGNPVAFFISIPEINQIFKHLDGKLDFKRKTQVLIHEMDKDV